MDNTGFFPEKTTPSGGDTVWRWGLDANPAFQEDGYTSVMQTDHYVTAGDPVESQWMYHAVSQAILARHILAADPMVDPKKIGIMGISWGSLITSLAIGYEKFAFAVLQYCAGYLNEARTYMGAYSKNHAAYDEMWRAENRWDHVDFPVLLLQWTGDYTATPNSNSRSYLHLKKAGAELSLIFDWFHAHDWSQEVSYYFANCAIAGKRAMVRAIDEPIGRNFGFRIEVPENVQVTACLRYMKTALAYRPVEGEDPNQWYRDQRVSVNGTWVSGTVPADAVCYYIEFSNMVDRGCFYSATSVVSLDG